ncbi:MAG TPA: type 2 lanthipeptide synthetase LanM family protein [Thermoanaerobaculia bacterium]|nr:type 2 lanthipeptide synthetase LanM family protein [Thermoanaerobaculia bacterium]
MQTPFPEAWRAFTLAERAAALRRLPRPLPPLGERERTLAEKRLARWRSQAPLDRDDVFASRLAAEGLSAEDFLWLLGTPPEALASHLPPAPWLDRLSEALVGEDCEPLPWPEEALRSPTAGFLQAAEPFVRRAREHLRRGLAELAPLPFDPNQTVDRLLLADLPFTLLPMLSRTLVLELHIAGLEERLEGETPEERLGAFLRELETPEARLALFGEYPVLARLLVEALDRWADAGLELLRRMAADWDAIRRAFSPDRDPGLLEHLDTRAGDPHRGGRTVVIARFTSGLRIVYKPKPLSVDRHFQELLAWLNANGVKPRLQTLAVLDRGTYGWVEHAAARSIASPEELRRFYRRQGGYLALLFALEAVDFHYQNLIAAGEHPILVDLESLFHARLEGPQAGAGGAEHQAARSLSYSVLRTGLLPRRRWYAAGDAEDAGAALDVSGLSAPDEPLAPRPVPIPVAAGGDLRIIRKKLPLDRGGHRPAGDAGATLLAHGDELMAGFRATYRLVAQHRGELTAAGGPLLPFADDEIRIILRPTRVYDAPLAESFHPELLRDALLRDRLFDRLWLEAVEAPHLQRVVPAEIRALWRGDIPLFTTCPASRDVRAGEGEVQEGLLQESGLDLVRARLASLGDSDLEHQLYFVRAALASLAPAANTVERGQQRLTGSDGIPGRDELIDAAAAIGHRLEALAIRGAAGETGDGGATWVGLHAALDGTLFLDPLPAPLHHGLGGIAVFLAHLGAATGEPRFQRLAREAWSTAEEQIRQDRAGLRSIGGFLGWGSLIVTLLHLGALWGEEERLAEVEGMVGEIAERLDEDQDLDVLGGTAGALIGLLRLPSDGRARELAVRCGDRLLGLARPMSGQGLRGLGWWGRGSEALPLTGFSHGAAGIGWALLELATVLGEVEGERFRAAALGAFEYERSTFQPRLDNWPDLRYYDLEGRPVEGKELPEFFPAWCHGAAGIALARAAALRHLDLPELRNDLQTAVRLVLARGFGYNQSLCHGDLGNLDVLLVASRLPGVSGGGDLGRQAGRIAGSILAGAREHGWRCGISYGAETPGLMAGLAGIGYGLLRLAEPDSIPSLLLLETPATAEALHAP